MPNSPAKKKWDAENKTRIVVDLHKRKDADILRKLGEIPSKQGYIKQLIREDINLSG